MEKSQNNSSYRPVTLHDVARHAGVSHITVSRVVNKRQHVATETRQRVMQSIEELGYHPVKSARMMRHDRSDLLALVTFSNENLSSVNTSIANSVHAAHEEGYDLLVEVFPSHDWQDVKRVLDRLKSWQVEGIIVPTTSTSLDVERILEYCDRFFPVVLRETRHDVTQRAVINHQYHGSKLVAQHLIALGHTQICAITGSPEWHALRMRHQAFQDTLLEANLTPGPTIEIEKWSPESGYIATKQLLKSGSRFTAIVTGHDRFALGALYALAEHEIAVPHDVAITGFDDTPEALYFQPPLTSVQSHYDRFGSDAVKLLIEHLRAPEAAPMQSFIYPELMVRASTVGQS